MAEINLEETIQVNGEVFFKGPAIVSDAKKKQIEDHLELLKELEATGEATEAPTKKKGK